MTEIPKPVPARVWHEPGEHFRMFLRLPQQKNVGDSFRMGEDFFLCRPEDNPLECFVNNGIAPGLGHYHELGGGNDGEGIIWIDEKADEPDFEAAPWYDTFILRNYDAIDWLTMERKFLDNPPGSYIMAYATGEIGGIAGLWFDGTRIDIRKISYPNNTSVSTYLGELEEKFIAAAIVVDVEKQKVIEVRKDIT